MKQTIKTLLIGGLAGFLGAYTFHLFSETQKGNSEFGKQFVNEPFSQNQPDFVDFDNAKGAGITEVPSFVEAAKISTPSVVYIKTASRNQRSYTWFDMFFGGEGHENKVIGSGSGVIFSKDGYIVTNNHVISGATEIEVIHHKRTYKAIVKGVDPSTDLALLKVEADNLPYIKITSSETVNVGDWVIAVGNPFNLTSTVTAGIVSAKGRNINILESQFPIESFIQTDAAINPGNSGGALVNLRGELVGINTAILSKTGSYTGYGFAVPSDIVTKVVTDLKQFGQVQKAFIGADVIEVTEEVYKELNLNDIAGVVVTYIEPDGAAYKVGLKRGDVILKINGKAVNSKTSFDEQLSYFKPGDKINVQYSREAKISEKQLQLTNVDGTTSVVKREVYKAESIGADLEVVPKAERSRFGIENGVRIAKINSNRGLIAQMGMEEGFIITEINNREIEDPRELANMLERIRGRVIVKGVTKNGQKGYYSYYF
ncbi:MAG: trypsin-like peptidase domain-containing protein [Thermoflexibacter sp.]|nr:trypsin-like peptidase domain-containing protein [Thermoflexibacter sp.]